MALEEDESCSLAHAERIFNELKEDDSDDMHTMQIIEGVDHLYFTWISRIEFVEELAAIIEKKATTLFIGAAAATAYLAEALF